MNVEFADIFEDCTKLGFKIKTEDYQSRGKYCIIDQGQNEIAGYTDLEDGLFKDVPAIIFGDHTRIIKYVTRPFFLGADGVKVLRSKKTDADYKYLFYALKSLRIPNTGYNRHFKWLKETTIKLVPLWRQKQIVQILDQVAAIKAARQKQLDALDELVKARFIEMFGDNRFPQTIIRNVVDTNIMTIKKVFKPTDIIKYIDISSIDNKNNVTTGWTEFVLKEAPSRAQQHIQKNDILISTVRPNLRNVAINDYDYPNVVASSGFCVLRATKCSPLFLKAIVCSDSFTDEMTRVVTGANYPAIKDDDVLSYSIPLPPKTIQEQFDFLSQQVEQLKTKIRESLAETETLFQSLMQEYFG